MKAKQAQQSQQSIIQSLRLTNTPFVALKPPKGIDEGFQGIVIAEKLFPVIFLEQRFFLNCAVITQRTTRGSRHSFSPFFEAAGPCAALKSHFDEAAPSCATVLDILLHLFPAQLSIISSYCTDLFWFCFDRYFEIFSPLTPVQGMFVNIFYLNKPLYDVKGWLVDNFLSRLALYFLRVSIIKDR